CVVAMRTDPQASRPLIDDHTRVPAAPHQLPRFAPRCDQGHDSRTILRPAAAVHLDAGLARLLAQMLREFQHSLPDGVDAEAEQQLQAGAQRRDAGDVQAAALPAAGVRLQYEVDACEVAGADHAIPADADRPQPLEQGAANPEEAGPFRSE